MAKMDNMTTAEMIGRYSNNDKRFKCLSCEKISTAEDIDNHTINNCCTNRGQRRMFVSINKTNRLDRKWYQCPICGVNAYRRNFEKVEED